jgi:hypothetical protein
MLFPQIIIYERDGKLAEVLREKSQLNRWSQREPRSPDSVLRLLKKSQPAILVLRTGRDLVSELTMLDRILWLYPETTAIVVTPADDPGLERLIWDLGATFVFSGNGTPQPMPKLVDHLMKTQQPARHA